MSLPYGSTDASLKEDAKDQAVKTPDAEQGDSPTKPGRTIMNAVDSLRDVLDGGGGVVYDNDKFEDLNEKGDIEDNSLLKQTVPDTKGKPPASSKRAGVINLVNNIIGSGILSMPAAVRDSSLVTSMGLMVLTGLISASSFMLIGYLCSKLECATYRQLWSKAFGKRSGIIVDITLLINSVLACLAYTIIIADLITETKWVTSRAAVIWIGTLVVILPLCHLKNLAALKYASTFAVFAFAYVFILMQVKFWNAGSGQWKLKDNMFKMDSTMLAALCIFNAAYKCHYNAPAFFHELDSNFGAFASVTGWAFLVCLVIYMIFSFAAFGLFGNATVGNVLENFGGAGEYSAEVLIAWLAMTFVVILGYPMAFKTGRESMFTLIPPLTRAAESHPLMSHSAVVTSMVAVVSFVGCLLSDVKLVVGLSGAIAGSALCWMMPAAIYLKCTFAKNTSDDAEGKTEVPRSQSLVVYTVLLFIVAAVCMVGGSVRTITKALEK